MILNSKIENQKKLIHSIPFFKIWKKKITFSESLSIQEKFKLKAKQGSVFFIGFEVKNPVITLGLRADSKHILWSKEQLKEKKISQLKIQRGGEATLHAPGQLVIYPIIHLPSLSVKIKDFIEALEKVTQNLLKNFGINTKKQGKYAGLYTSKGKLCFFGIHVSGGVSQHGLSINFDNDLKLFDSIKSCGEAERCHDGLSLYTDFSLSKKDFFFKWCEKAEKFFSQ